MDPQDRMSGDGDPTAAETPLPWRAEPPIPLAVLPDAPGCAYGFVWGKRLHCCAWERLVERCEAHPQIPAVWTPETGGLVRPEAVPALVEAVRERVRRRARRSLVVSGAILGGLLALFAFVAWPAGLRFQSVVWLLVMLVGLDFAMRAAAARRARGFGGAELAQARQSHRYAAWVRTRRAVYTVWLAVLIGAVALFGIWLDEAAVEAVGLVKERVWRGEAWRLLTGPLLHVYFFHAWMNLGALLAIGPLVEAHSPRGRLPLVFLVSALGGSVLSALLLSGSSVGASGGILGVVGYLAVLGLRRRAQVPDDFRRRMALVIGATAALGALGLAFVDNAAHLGGFAAGAALGALLLPPDREEDHDPPAVRWAGWGSLAILTAAALLAIALMLVGA